MTTTPMPVAIDSETYRAAYSRINGMVVVGEGLADRHFRQLARAIPEDRGELLRLAAMEGRHARDFVGCARNLGVRADTQLAQGLFAPLQALFVACDRAGDLAGCLAIQGLIVECFAVAAYRHYLPVADPYAQPITAAVLADEAEHLSYAERWLGLRLEAVQVALTSACRQALPVAMTILKTLSDDMRQIGVDPSDVLASFCDAFQGALERVGYEARAARRLLSAAAAATLC